MGRTKARGLLVLIAVVVVAAGCSSSSGGGDGGSDGPPAGPTSTIVLSTSSTTTSTSTSTTTTSTTSPASTSTTVDAGALYGEINAEIQRACDAAIESGQIPVPEYQARWDSVSTPEKLKAAVQSCVAARQDAPPAEPAG